MIPGLFGFAPILVDLDVGVLAGQHQRGLRVVVHRVLFHEGPVRGQVVEDLRAPRVDVLLRRDHVPHQPVGAPRLPLALEDEGDVVRDRELVPLVGQPVRPDVVGVPQPRRHPRLQLAVPVLHRRHVVLVLPVELDLEVVRQDQHRHTLRHPVAQLVERDPVAVGIAPLQLLQRVRVLELERPCQVALGAVVQPGEPGGGPAVAREADEIAVLRPHLGQHVRVEPDAPDDVARVRQVGLPRPPVPPHLAPVGGAHPEVVLERVVLAGDLHPADADAHHLPEGVAAVVVEVRHAQVALEDLVDRLGPLEALVVLGLQDQVRPDHFLEADHRVDDRRDLVEHQRRDAVLLHPPQKVGRELVAVVELVLDLGARPPGRLRVRIVQELRDLLDVVGPVRARLQPLVRSQHPTPASSARSGVDAWAARRARTGAS